MRVSLIAAILALCAGDAVAGSMALPRSEDGIWRAEGQVNGRGIELVVDADAMLVTLTPDDARAAGIDLRHLDFCERVHTVNGPSRAARVKLERVQIGAVRVRDVDAQVIESGVSRSLLGQSFLNRLEHVQVRGQLLRLQN